MKNKGNLLPVFLTVMAVLFTESFSQVRDTYSDTWVATDELGRALPTNAEVGNPRTNKTVGLFYYIWLHETVSWKIHDLSKIIAGKEPYGGARSFHHFSQPLFGYYSSQDEFVIRKHIQMITDAGVDFIFFDNTNGLIYQETQEKILNTLLAMKSEGRKVPYVSWATYNGPIDKQIELLYDSIATKPKYQELFFRWQGKILLLGKYNGPRTEVKNYFTIKTSWAWTDRPWYTETSGKDRWPWLDNYPQKPGLDSKGNIEQMAVASAQHPHGQYAIGKSTGADRTAPPKYGTDGKYFALQWSRALEVDPPLIMVIQWNEWIAQRFIKGHPDFNQPVTHMIRKPIKDGESIFIDGYTPEYSRDLEPLRTDYRDNMYLQLASNIRKYKGVRKIPRSTGAKPIVINNDFTQWNNVGPEFLDDSSDVTHRNHVSFGSDLTYTNTTGRNDIVAAKVSYDKQHIYFYVRTAKPLSSHTQKNWMYLLINTDTKYSTGWNGYDVIVNHTVNSATQTTIKKHSGTGFNWSNAVNVQYLYKDNQMHIRIPATTLNVDTQKPFTLDFKWVDNSLSTGDILDLYVDGDAAPNGRFNYRFISSGAGSDPQFSWDFKNSMLGWRNPQSLNVKIEPNRLALEITGKDPFIFSPDNIGVDAKSKPYVLISMQNMTSDTIMQFYWATQGSPAFSKEKSVSMKIVANDTKLRTYAIDLSKNDMWSGTLKQLRFDPVASAQSGIVYLDAITLTTVPTTGIRANSVHSPPLFTKITGGIVHLAINNQITSKKPLIITNSMGQVVLSQQLPNVSNKMHYTIDMRSFPAGIYFMNYDNITQKLTLIKN